jgi:hypothetical protein
VKSYLIDNGSHYPPIGGQFLVNERGGGGYIFFAIPLFIKNICCGLRLLFVIYHRKLCSFATLTRCRRYGAAGGTYRSSTYAQWCDKRYIQGLAVHRRDVFARLSHTLQALLAPVSSAHTRLCACYVIVAACRRHKNLFIFITTSATQVG